MNRFAPRPSSGLCRLACALILVQTCLPAGVSLADGLAGVSGGTVVAGQASIAQDGSTLNVNTMTDRTIINWNGFSIGSGETANFLQPGANSAVLNRVTTPNNPSAIFGAMNSNGNVILVNPSGIVVGETGVINTNGFTASVLDIPNNEFLKGGVLNFRGDSTASVINEGTIKTGSGGAALIGGDVINNGTITSEGGSISLASGGSVTLSDGSRFTHADMATIESGISPTAGLIKNSGTIRATGAIETGGEVFLVNPGGKIMNDGTVAAYRQKQDGLSGGNVTVAATNGFATIGGEINVSGRSGGSVVVEAEQIQVTSAKIDASGDASGGSVSIGGGFQGNDASIANAKTTTVDSDSVINANAMDSGDGGTVVVWSNESTEFYGAISSTGGANGGDGGLVEVSGAALAFQGTVDTTAENGNTGWLLLDPLGILVYDGPASDPLMGGSDPLLSISDGTLNEQLSLSNVLLATSPTAATYNTPSFSLALLAANDDFIVIDDGTAIDTGSNTLYLSTSTLDLYSTITGTVAGGADSFTPAFNFALKDPTTVNVYEGASTTGSIQDAVDVIANGGTINVGDGTFAGGININKTVSLLGDGSTNTSLIEVASNSAGMTVTARDVLIDGFRFVPENGAVNTIGIALGQGFQRARDTTIRDVAMRDLTQGIVGNRIDRSLTISDVDIRRIEEQGIAIQSSLFFDNVLIEDANIVSGGEAVLFAGSLNSSAATIRSSRLVSEGTDAVRFARDINGSFVLIGGTGSSDGNRIRGSNDGIDIDGNVNLFSQVRVTGNERIVGGDDAIDLDGNLFLSSVVVADNGLIRGDDDAINFDGGLLLSEVQITDNQDVRASDDGISFANVAASRVEIAGNNVRLGSTGIGLNLAYSADSELTIGPGNSFDGGVDGIVLGGSDGEVLLITGNTINDTAFSNQSGDYIRLEDTALFDPGNPTVIDAKDATFEGLRGSEMSAAQLFATEDKMFHFPDDSTLGLFDISELFVVQGESIQLAVNAAGALGGAQEVVVGAGTFGGSVEVWVDNLTMIGTGETTIIDTDAVDPFANNGDRDTGFELTTTSPIASNFEINNVTVDGFAFTGSGGTTGILLGEGSRRADDTTIRNSFFDGLSDGIAARSLDDGLTISNVRMRNISEQGIDIRTTLGGDEEVLIEDSNIVSDGEAVLFAGSVNGTEVTISSNRLRSRDSDAVRFARDARLAQIQMDENRIQGDDEAIDFDGDIEASVVDIVNNKSIVGGDDAIAVDGAISLLSQVRVSDNGEVVGEEDGINVNVIFQSLFQANRNTLIKGKDGSGIEFDDTVLLSNVEVAANEEVVGGDYGIEFDTDVILSRVRIAGNDKVRGKDVSGISFRGGVETAAVGIVNNGKIRGGDDGVEFESVENSLVRIARNTRIEGEDVAGIRFDGNLEESTVRIINNDKILGDNFGIDFDNPVIDSRIRVARNELVRGDKDSGIRFDNSIDDSSVRIVRNDKIRGGDYGIEVDGNVIDSLVLIRGNEDIKGDLVSGIAFRRDLNDSDVLVLNNDKVRGGDNGIEFGRIVDGTLIVGNNRIVADNTGVKFNRQISGDASVQLIDNRIKAGNGIRMEPFTRVVDDASLEIIDNEIVVTSPSGTGIRLSNLDSSNAALVRGGSVTGGAIGLAVIQNSGQPDGKVIVDGLVVNQASDIGLLFQTLGELTETENGIEFLPFTGSLEVMLMNEVTVNGGTGPGEVGMVFDGLGLSLTGDTLADSRFVGNTGNFIELRNGGLFEPGRPTLIDGTGVFWDGLDAAIPAQRQQIIDRIVDFIDDPTLGLIFPGAGPNDDQTYDRFTRYQDFWETIDSLMGPYPTGSITYRTPIFDVDESLEDQGQNEDAASEDSQANENADESPGTDLAQN